MDLKIDINPEQINAAVSEAILKSAIGEALNAAIKKQVDTLSRSYDNPIDHVIAGHIRDAISGAVKEQFGPQIQSFVSAKITEKFTNDLLDKLWQSWIDKNYR